MGSRYVKIEELEKLFAEYAIPYTNIFDEMPLVLEEDIAKNMSVLDLKTVMESKDEVVATQIWQREDIHSAIRAMRMQAEEIIPEDTAFIDKVAETAKPVLENCSDNWDRLHAVIRQCM